MEAEIRIIDTRVLRRVPKKLLRDVRTNMSPNPVVIRDDDDYRVVACGRCLCQVRRIADSCFRYSGRNGEEGISDTLHDAFLKVGYKLVADRSGNYHVVDCKRPSRL